MTQRLHRCTRVLHRWRASLRLRTGGLHRSSRGVPRSWAGLHRSSRVLHRSSGVLHRSSKGFDRSPKGLHGLPIARDVRGTGRVGCQLPDAGRTGGRLLAQMCVSACELSRVVKSGSGTADVCGGPVGPGPQCWGLPRMGVPNRPKPVVTNVATTPVHTEVYHGNHSDKENRTP